MVPARQTANGSGMYSVLVSVILKRLIFYFHKWSDIVSTIRAMEDHDLAATSLTQAKQIMKKSTRGQRSMVEQEALGKLLSSLSCIPKMSSVDMGILTNNIDSIDCSGRTLIFLQGDFGACFYIIATGNIELYLEPSKDQEMSNCRNFGVFRGNSLDLEQCGALGRLIVTLKAGQGFGEYAILSSTHKFRGATAVAADDCLLFVVYADTYNAILRKHHFRQQQMSSAIALLKELPIFNFQSNAKIAQFAYNLRCQTYSPRTVIASAKAQIRTLYLINSGSIKVVANMTRASGQQERMITTGEAEEARSRRPDLCALELGRGQIIGLWEILKEQETYEMTYTSSTACELLEISRQFFQEVISAAKKIPARSGEGVPAPSPRPAAKCSLSPAGEHKAPAFVTSMHKKPRDTPTHNHAHGHRPAPRTTLPAPPAPADSFYSVIRNASDTREALHCGRLSRVNESLRGKKEVRSAAGALGAAAFSSITLFSADNNANAIKHDGHLEHDRMMRGPSQPINRKLNREPHDAVAVAAPAPASQGIIRAPSSPATSRGGGGGGGGGGLVQQYRSAVYHVTESSTTNVVSISRDEITKKINLTSSFVKSELLAAPPLIQFSTSRVNKSPNKSHRQLANEM